MAFSVADLLELPALIRARPEVACGERLGTREVRWVHSSEIFDIAPLLRGGEVLLTTGLGLVALSPEARRTYIAAIARVGVAALVLELGRTFVTAPPELIDEGHRAGLPVILLHEVVPFIEVTEAAHLEILGGELAQLRAATVVRDALLASLSATRGLVAFTGAIGELARCAAALYSRDGELVAGTAADDARGDAGPGGDQPGFNQLGISQLGLNQPGLNQLGDNQLGLNQLSDNQLSGDVTVSGEVWGHLVLAAPPTPHLRAVLDAALPLLALEVGRSGAIPVSRNQAGADLLRDMVTGRYVSTAELASRALGVGLLVRPGQRALAICVRSRSATAGSGSVLIAAREVASRVYGASLVAEHDGDVLLGVLTRPRELRATLERFADELGRELRSTIGGGVMVSAGPAVEDVPALVSSFPSARDTARLAMRLAPTATVVLSADFALYQLLISLVDDEALEAFVTEQLGPLLAHDARTGAGLVMTLDAYLAAGMSKTRTADALGIRRQTLYGRLERIGTLLGDLDLDNRERRTALDLALVSWRLRLSAARGR
jgi:purine catabolism regulator